MIAFLRALRFFNRFGRRRFRPGVYYSPDLRITDIILADKMMVWQPLALEPSRGHAIDCGYDSRGDLVGVRIWADIRFRRRDKPEAP